MQVPRYWRMKQHLYRLTASEMSSGEALNAEIVAKPEPSGKQSACSAEPVPAKFAIVA